MRINRESGFSLVEAMVAIVLLGIIVIGFARFTYSPDRAYQTNVAVMLAEEKIEECREVASNSFNNLHNTTSLPGGNSPIIQIATREQNTTNYQWAIAVDGLVLAANPAAGTSLENNAFWTSTIPYSQANEAAVDSCQVKRVTVTISVGGQILVRRVAYIPRIY